MNTFIKKCLSLFLAMSTAITVGSLSYGIGIAAEETQDLSDTAYTSMQSPESAEKKDEFL